MLHNTARIYRLGTLTRRPALTQAAYVPASQLRLGQPASRYTHHAPTPQSRQAAAYADQNDTWVDRHAPAAWVPYLKLARVDRPIGTWLLLWPSLWSIGLAAPVGQLPDIRLCALFGVGAYVMRGAGCTINDMWDRQFDAQVARTSQRPLATGAVSMPQAVAFLGAQLSAGLAVLLQLNTFSWALGAAALVPVALYPAMKRWTWWPQAFLGLTFNWGAGLGWAAVHGSLHPALLPLYAGSIAWTIVYDTIYAHQDKADDSKLGLKSTALLFGEHSKAVLTGFACAAGAGWAAAGAMLPADMAMSPAYMAAVAGCTGHLLWQVHTADWDDRQSCNDRFVSNMWLGGLLMAGIVAGKLLAPKKREQPRLAPADSA